MRTTSIKQSFCGILFFIVILVSCATTKPVMEWKDPSYTGGPFNNILIVAVSDQEAVRRTFESSFVERLQEYNIKATPSFTVIPSGASISEENIRPVISDREFDSVIVTHLVGVEEKEVYHPPAYRPAPYRGFYGYYGYVGDYVYEPGYYSRQKQVRLETNLFDTQTEQLIWSMQSETMNPNSEKVVIDGTINTAVERLKKQSLIAVK